MKRATVKRILSIILLWTMVFSLIPQIALTTFAANDSTTIDVSDSSGTNLPTGVTYASNLFTIDTAANGTTINVIGTTTSSAITVNTGVTGVTLVLRNASISSSSNFIQPISLKGTANVTIQLADDTTNTLDASTVRYSSGMFIESTATVNITGDTNGTGTLIAKGGWLNAGIGGGYYADCGTINISSGTVCATGGNSGAGIGGGYFGAVSTINISGGTVKATGGYGGAGIGGGASSTGGNITISGSANITATGGGDSAGIGGGFSGQSCNINIATSTFVMAASSGSKPAIDALSGSIGSMINAKSSKIVFADTYVKCNSNVLKFPAGYSYFAFSATGPYPVSVYSDANCETLIYDVVTSSDKSLNIPVSTNIYDAPTAVEAELTGTVNLYIDPSNGQVTASATGGNTDSVGTLTYTWSGGAAGTGTTVTSNLGSAATCTVTASGAAGSIQATTTVYKVTVAKSGNTGTDDASISNAYGKDGDNISIAYTLDGSETQSNTITYSGAASNPSTVSATGNGASAYTILTSDATSGEIVLTAAFAHINKPTLTGTVSLSFDASNGQLTASVTGGNTGSVGTLTYTWSGGATGTGTTVTPTPGSAATCTVTASGAVDSIQTTTTVYKVSVVKSGNTGTDNANIANAYGKVGESISINYTLDGSGTQSNTITYSGAASNPPTVNTAGNGTSTYTIVASDATSGEVALTATFAHNNTQSSVSTYTSTPTSTPIPTPAAPQSIAEVNGEKTVAGTVTNITNAEGEVSTSITIDSSSLTKELDNKENGATVTIPFTNSTDNAVGQLNGQDVKNMEDKSAILFIQTDKATYALPASQINIDAVPNILGTNVSLKDIKVDISIASATNDQVQKIESAANQTNTTILVSPVNFDIKCTYNGAIINISKFNSYVERMVAIPQGIDASKITTGIVLNADGTLSHIPTVITVINGKYYAKISSLTNSTYSIIYHPIEFKDVVNHWAKDAVNDMGSRLIISGVGEDKFEPNRDITRAEFTEIVIKALGLMRPGTGKDSFTDVAKDAWYYDAVSIAYEYGIITGYGEGKFGPADKITREQAMVIIARVMKITKLKVDIGPTEAEQLIAAFSDSGDASAWAKNEIALCVKAEIVSGRDGKRIVPMENITRAEVAVIVKSLLKKSSLM